MGGWKDVLVSASTSIREVTRILNESALQIILVVDDCHRLQGTPAATFAAAS